jgi:hypothetical protein
VFKNSKRNGGKLKMQLQVPTWDNLPALTWKNKVALLAHEFQKLEQTSCPVEHIFEDGKYIREMRIPKDTLFIGREHIHGHAVQLVDGEAVLITPDGKHYFKGFSEIHTNPGAHAVAYILTDVVCRTVHPNPDNSRDVEALEAAAFEPAEKLFALGRQVKELITFESAA